MENRKDGLEAWRLGSSIFGEGLRPTLFANLPHLYYNEAMRMKELLIVVRSFDETQCVNIA